MRELSILNWKAFLFSVELKLFHRSGGEETGEPEQLEKG